MSFSTCPLVSTPFFDHNHWMTWQWSISNILCMNYFPHLVRLCPWKVKFNSAILDCWQCTKLINSPFEPYACQPVDPGGRFGRSWRQWRGLGELSPGHQTKHTSLQWVDPESSSVPCHHTWYRLNGDGVNFIDGMKSLHKALTWGDVFISSVFYSIIIVSTDVRHFTRHLIMTRF